jgi:hypothetical protein
MRVNPFDFSALQFTAAVLNIGPQHILTEDDQGRLRVIMAVRERPDYFVALPPNTYVPVLIKFSGPESARPFEIDTISDQPDGQRFTFSNERLVLLDELAQRLAEDAIERNTDPAEMSRSAVDLWFNAGLIVPERAVDLTLDLARRYHWQDEWTLTELRACLPTDSLRLRSLVRAVVSGVAQEMKQGYGYAMSST